MSYSLRGRTVGYSNIAVGSASGVERTINGAAPPSDTTYGARDKLSNAALTPESVRKSDTDLVDATHTTDPLAAENLSSSDIPGHTS